MTTFKRKIITSIMLLSLIAICSGCGKDKVEENQPSESPTTIVTTRTKDWFDKAVSNYTSETFDDFKEYSTVYEVRTGVSEDNVLQYVTADIYLYVEASKVERQDVADFSDNFAKKFASDSASGNIKCSIYIVPSSVYSQIEEGNHLQVEEKAKGLDDYSKFSFKYEGIGDAIDTMKKEMGIKTDTPKKESEVEDTTEDTGKLNINQ